MGRESYRAAATLPLTALLAIALVGCDGGSTTTTSTGGAAKKPAGAAATPKSSGALERETARNAAEQYLNTGHPEKALVIAERLGARDPQDAVANELLARVLLAQAILQPAHERGP